MSAIEESFDNVTKLWRETDFERKLHDKMHIRMNLLEEQLDLKSTKLALKEKEKLKNGNYKVKRERRSLEALQTEEMDSSSSEKVEKRSRRKKMKGLKGLYRPVNNPYKAKSYEKGTSAACTCCHICRNSIAKKHREFMCCSSCHYVYCKSCFTAKLTEWAWDDVKDLTDWVCRVCLGTCRCQRCSVRGPPRWYGHKASMKNNRPTASISPPPSPQNVPGLEAPDSASEDEEDDEDDESVVSPPHQVKPAELPLGLETTEPIFGELTNDYFGSNQLAMEDIPPLFPEVLSICVINYPKGKEEEKQEKSETATNDDQGLYFVPQFELDSKRCSCCHSCRSSLKAFPRPYKECDTCWCNYCTKCFGTKVKESWEGVIRISRWVCPVCKGVCDCQRCKTRKKLKWYGQMKNKCS